MNPPLSRRIVFSLVALAAFFFAVTTQADLTNAVTASNSAPAIAEGAVVTATNSAAQMTNGVVSTAPLSPLTNSLATTFSSTGSPNVAGSLVRVMGMLALVLALFLGGVWLFRNWQRLTMPRGQSPKLNILETRSLGGRHALFVVGYEHERFLIASSPVGINMLTHLHSAEETSGETQKPAAPQPSFGETLAQMLKGGKRP